MNEFLIEEELTLNDAAYHLPTEDSITRHTFGLKKLCRSIAPTPSVQLSSIKGEVDLHAKLESFNPTGSIKYRAALFMLQQAVTDGELNEGGTVVESSSGNLGAALARVCSELGFKYICVADVNAQSWNLDLVRQYGGDVELVSYSLDGCFLKARLARVKQILKDNPDYYWTNQYENLSNMKAHYESTAKEILDEYGDSLDMICVPTSSTGTIGGIIQRFRECSPHTKIIAIDAKYRSVYGRPTGERRIPGMGAGVKPELAKQACPDHVFLASDHQAIMGCYRAFENDDLFLGGSSGAAVEMVWQNRMFFEGKKVLLICPDGGEKYQDTIYNDQWLRSEFAISQDEFRRYVKERSFSAA